MMVLWCGGWLWGMIGVVGTGTFFDDIKVTAPPREAARLAPSASVVKSHICSQKQTSKSQHPPTPPPTSHLQIHLALPGLKGAMRLNRKGSLLLTCVPDGLTVRFLKEQGPPWSSRLILMTM